MLPLMSHLPLVNTDVLSTGVAELGKHVLEAATAVGPAITHDVALSSQLLVALHAAEVLHVPAGTLGLGALVREDDLTKENGRLLVIAN